jgi:hypothetical protein
MLQVTVSHPQPPQFCTHGGEGTSERQQGSRFVEVVLDIVVEANTVDPLHLQNRVDVPFHANPIRSVVEADLPGGLHTAQESADLGVAAALVDGGAGEALHGVVAARGRHLEHDSETAGSRFG